MQWNRTSRYQTDAVPELNGDTPITVWGSRLESALILRRSAVILFVVSVESKRFGVGVWLRRCKVLKPLLAFAACRGPGAGRHASRMPRMPRMPSMASQPSDVIGLVILVSSKT